MLQMWRIYNKNYEINTINNSLKESILQEKKKWYKSSERSHGETCVEYWV